MVRENWGSRFGFIMATAGFAIGMGNIWRFPYIVGESGGGAFILVYLILTAIIGVPLLTAEVSLGRKAQLTPLAGMKKVIVSYIFLEYYRLGGAVDNHYHTRFLPYDNVLGDCLSKGIHHRRGI